MDFVGITNGEFVVEKNSVSRKSSNINVMHEKVENVKMERRAEIGGHEMRKK